MHKTIQHYFEDSYKNVVSFFAKEEKISVSELKEIISIIEKNQKNQS
jgi:predicted transcriptional regulator